MLSRAICPFPTLAIWQPPNSCLAVLSWDGQNPLRTDEALYLGEPLTNQRRSLPIHMHICGVESFATPQQAISKALALGGGLGGPAVGFHTGKVGKLVVVAFASPLRKPVLIMFASLRFFSLFFSVVISFVWPMNLAVCLSRGSSFLNYLA